MADLHDFGVYANRVLGSLMGSTEGFYDASYNTVSFATIGAYAASVVLFVFIMILANCVGAARLSWCYNTFYGETTGMKFVWSLLCFFFSGFYFPFYAIILDPVCGRVAQRGGRKV